MKRVRLMMVIVAVSSVIGCTNMRRQQQGTLSGAAIGGAAAAGIASIAGGSAWTGLAIGAAAGGVAGNIKANRQ